MLATDEHDAALAPIRAMLPTIKIANTMSSTTNAFFPDLLPFLNKILHPIVIVDATRPANTAGTEKQRAGP